MDLSTQYLGLKLRNPLVASASPLAGTPDGVRALADAGVAAVVLPSLFEEQLRQEAGQDAALADAGADSFPESLSYFPAAAESEPGPRRYLSLVKRAVAAVDVPVIASLNGVTTGGWTDYASALEDAGAAAIELNVYHLPGDPLVPGRDVELQQVEILTTVKAVVHIPVAVKLSPYFSSPGEMALRLDRVGADGLVLFNRWLQPDIDPETLSATRGFGLSARDEGRLPRAWIARLAGHVRASLAGSTGVTDATDVLGYLLAGADVVMTTSALLRNGPGYAGTLLDGLDSWLRRKGFADVAAVRGKLAAHATPGSERAGYVSTLRTANRGTGPWAG